MYRSFIEDYLENPSSAIANARKSAGRRLDNCIDDELVYLQLKSPEFRLYEVMAL